MKHLKYFEGLNKKTVDTNKIYVFMNAIIGKIDLNNNDFAPIISGFYMEEKNNSTLPKIPWKATWDFITPKKWTLVREATPDEIKIYNDLKIMNKFNL